MPTSSLSRRSLLRSGAILVSGAAAAGLAACGGSTPQPTATAPGMPPTPSPAPPAVAATAVPPPSTVVPPTSPTVAEATTAPVSPTVASTEPPPAATAAPTEAAAAGQAYLAVAHGASPAAITTAAIDAIGGISRFVASGDDVVVKPNLCVAYHGPEYAATTNPEVVGTIVRLCKDAGASRVRVMDYPFGGSARDAYSKSGIEEAVVAAGGVMESMSQVKYGEVDFPAESVDIRKWRVYQGVLDANVLINVPIAKHHGTAVLSLGAKNLMGLVEDRNVIHVNLHQRIADLLAFFRPQLTVMDAVRILMANGPSGGDLADVKEMNTVIASHDTVAVDAYTTRFFDFADTDRVAYIKLSAAMGLGTIDLDGVDVREIEAG
ncbi:MAG: DUF362 domain-containing protein [Anaerolineae bacterium]